LLNAPRLSCGNPGVEQGAYSYVKATSAFTWLSASKDTNGCAGLADAANPANNIAVRTFALSTDGKTLTVTGAGGASFSFSRVSK
jgi:hypothetical protein